MAADLLEKQLKHDCFYQKKRGISLSLWFCKVRSAPWRNLQQQFSNYLVFTFLKIIESPKEILFMWIMSIGVYPIIH